MTPSPAEQPIEEIDRWDLGWKVLLRYDQYISATNAKAGFILALNGGVLTLIFNWLSKTPEIERRWLVELWPVFVATLTIVVIAVILMTLVVVSPRLWSPKNSEVPKSVIYFASVASQKCSEYKDLVKSTGDDVLINDVLIQAHTVGRLLSDKFKLLLAAFRGLIYLQMPLFLFMIAIKILAK